GSPRLLLVGEDLAAPEPVDPLEDWIRLPAGEDDLRVRVATLATRAGGMAAAPAVDEDGLLRYRGRSARRWSIGTVRWSGGTRSCAGRGRAVRRRATRSTCTCCGCAGASPRSG